MAVFGRRDRELALALAAGQTIKDAAEAAGLSERTAHRRLQSAEFLALVTKARSTMFERAAGRLASAAAAAAGTLADLAADAASDGVRLSAAKAVLEAGMKWRDGQEFDQRLTKVEQAIHERTGTATGGGGAGTGA